MSSSLPQQHWCDTPQPRLRPERPLQRAPGSLLRERPDLAAGGLGRILVRPAARGGDAAPGPPAPQSRALPRPLSHEARERRRGRGGARPPSAQGAGRGRTRRRRAGRWVCSGCALRLQRRLLPASDPARPWAESASPGPAPRTRTVPVSRGGDGRDQAVTRGRVCGSGWFWGPEVPGGSG